MWNDRGVIWNFLMKNLNCKCDNDDGGNLEPIMEFVQVG